MNVKTIKIKKYSPNIRSINRSELRKSLMTILERDLKHIKNKRVLEIGCGNWDFAKKILEKNKCEWHGFEPVNFGKENLTFVKGSVKNIPYHNNSFDIVLCNQTMEHWFEYNVSLKMALKEINRVLKPKSVLMINSPIHLHGDPRFLIGELNKINNVFKKDLWSIVLFERVFPVKNVQGWKKIASKGFFSRVGYPNILIPNHEKATSYLINIHAIKKTSIKQKLTKKSNSLRNLKVFIRFIKTYIYTRFF